LRYVCEIPNIDIFKFLHLVYKTGLKRTEGRRSTFQW